MDKIKKKPILIFIIAFIALYVLIYVVPKVSGALVSSYTVEYGELKISDTTTACLVRNEKVYLAANGGKTNYYIKDGTMVRKGTAILEVTGNTDKEPAAKYNDILDRLGSDVIKTSSYAVEESGIVSFYTDGYESKLTPKNMEKTTYEDYSSIDNKEVKELNRSSVSKGEPVFKVVDRTLWYLVCFVDNSSAKRYNEGDKLTVNLGDDVTLDTAIYKVSNDKSSKKTRVILSTNNYYKNFANDRTTDIELIISNESGLIIYNDSIALKKGKQGVYVKNKAGDYQFVPIKVISTDGEKSVIVKTSFYDENGDLVETVRTYDEVLKNAK